MACVHPEFAATARLLRQLPANTGLSGVHVRAREITHHNNAASEFASSLYLKWPAGHATTSRLDAEISSSQQLKTYRAVLMRFLYTLHTLQERDPRSYQIYVQLPSGACFLGSTPEQLYARSGSAVASEAVAATRPRGPAGDHAFTVACCCEVLLLCVLRLHTCWQTHQVPTASNAAHGATASH